MMLWNNSLNILQQVTRLFLAGLSAIILARYFFLENIWVVLPALFLTQIRIGYWLGPQVLFQVVLGIMASALVFLVSLAGEYSYLTAIILSLTSFLSAYIGFRKIKLFLPAFLINLLIIMAGSLPVHLTAAWQRSVAFLLGMVIATIVTTIIWPSFLKKQIKLAIKRCLKITAKMFKLIFTIYLDQNYKENHLYYEKKIYYFSRLFSENLALLHHLLPATNEVIEKLQRIFEIVTGLGALRYRVQDHYDYEIINQELKELSVAFLAKFNHKQQAGNVEGSINKLEEIYRIALQVAAKEPLLFLFFINNLHSLNEELSNLCK